MSQTLVENTRTEQSVSTDTLVANARTEQAGSARTFGILAIILTVLAFGLTVVGGMTSSGVLSLSALAPLLGATALFAGWNARALTRI